MEIKITVPGAPVGKGRPRFMRNGHTYTPDRTRDYEEKVRLCWKTQSGKGFAGGVPLAAEIVGYFPVPRSLSRKRREAMDGTAHVKKPDADNVCKAILDALNGCAYPDDAAVCSLTARKINTNAAPRVEVTITEAEV